MGFAFTLKKGLSHKAVGVFPTAYIECQATKSFSCWHRTETMFLFSHVTCCITVQPHGEDGRPGPREAFSGLTPGIRNGLQRVEVHVSWEQGKGIVCFSASYCMVTQNQLPQLNAACGCQPLILFKPLSNTGNTPTSSCWKKVFRNYFSYSLCSQEISHFTVILQMT